MLENYDFNIILKDCKILFSKINNNEFRNKTILITGANGLIGSFLSDYFYYLNIQHNFNINLYLTSFSKKENLPRISHLVDKKNVFYFNWDASTEVDPSILPQNIDYTFFCSGYGQPAKFTKDIVKTSFLNTIGVNSILKHINTNKKSKFLFLSSSEIYGEPDVNNIPTKETYNGNYSLTNPRSSYICSKRLGEIICNSYKEQIDVKICRVGLMYGPGTLFNDERVLQDFIFKANKNKTINLLDSGDSIRNYLYLRDGIEMLLNIVLNNDTSDTTYNVGGEFEPLSIYELALKVAKILNSTVSKKQDKQEHEMTKNSPKNVCLSMEKYKQQFKNYGKNFVMLDEGILNVVKWYKFI